MRRLSQVAFAAGLVALPFLPAAQEVSVNLDNERAVKLADNRRNPGEMNAIAIGDVDGDGAADLVTGAPRASGFLSIDTGMVYVRFGANYWDDVMPALDDQGMYYDFTAPPSVISNMLYSSVTLDDALGRNPSGVQIFAERQSQAFGSSVAVGDFNGDNFADIAIGQPAPFNNELGSVYVLFGRADIGGRLNIETEIFNLQAFEIMGRENGSRFGEKLLFHDIDNDGLDDLIIGTPRSGTGGIVDVVYGDDSIALPGTRVFIDGMPVFVTRIFTGVAGERLGTDIAAGDFNGDGFGEIVLGAPRWPSALQGNGRVVVINLQDSHVPGVDLSVVPPYIEVSSTFPNMGLGQSVAVGDVDGDSLEDLIVGAPFATVGSSANAGVVFVLSNPASSAGSTINVPADANLQISGQQPQEFFGRALAVGQFDTSLGPELAVGAPGTKMGTSANAGAVYVYRAGTLPTGVMDRYEGGLPIIRYYAPRANFQLGSQLCFGNFDGEEQLDLFMTGVGFADFPGLCATDIQSEYLTCHEDKEGIQVYGVLAGTLQTPSTGLSAKPGWLMME